MTEIDMGQSGLSRRQDMFFRVFTLCFTSVLFLAYPVMTYIFNWEQDMRLELQKLQLRFSLLPF